MGDSRIHLFLVVDYCPLYLEMKLAFFVRLMHPTYKGAAYLWYGKLKLEHKKLDDTFYSQCMGAIATMRLPIPEAARIKVSAVEVSSKEEAIEQILIREASSQAKPKRNASATEVDAAPSATKAKGTDAVE